MEKLLIQGFRMHELGIFNQKHPGIPFIKKAIENQLRTLLDEGLKWVIITGQMGTELWAAEVALELKEEFPHLQLAVIPPFAEQEKNWNEEKQEYYHSILSRADFVKPVSNLPYQNPKQFRQANEFLLAHSDGILLFYDDEKESTVKYIKEMAELKSEEVQYPIFTITSYDLQVLVEEEQEKHRTDW